MIEELRGKRAVHWPKQRHLLTEKRTKELSKCLKTKKLSKLENSRR